MCAPTKSLSARRAREKSASASSSRPCLARTAPRRLSASASSGLVFRMEFSCCSASCMRSLLMSAAARSSLAASASPCARADNVADRTSRSATVAFRMEFDFMCDGHRLPPRARLRVAKETLAPRGASEIFLLDEAPAFPDCQNTVHARVGYTVNRAARPAHFDEVNLRAPLKAEVQS